ncbi:MAG: alpha/beta hydrolase [Desulfobulbaceae bacterium]
MHFFAPLIVLAALTWAILCAGLYLMQDRLLYYPNLPSRELRANPADAGMEYEPVFLTTPDGVRLHGWYVPAVRPRGVLLFFHGNAGNISHRLDSLRIFNRLGLSTLIIDYRGYGQSGGRASEEGIYQDAETAWNHLVEERGISPDRIILFGRSLGGAVAAHLAARHRSGALILESVFTSVPDLAAGYYPVFPVRLLSRNRYEVRKTLPGVNSPVLIIHSPDDEIIPYRHGRALFEAAAEPKTFLRIHGGHNEGFLESGSLYTDGLARFLQSVLG